MWKVIGYIVLIIESYAIGIWIGWGLGYKKALEDHANNKPTTFIVEK